MSGPPAQIPLGLALCDLARSLRMFLAEVTRSMFDARLAALCSLASLSLLACGDPADLAPSELDWHGPPAEELETTFQAVTCSPHLEYYPVGGPHNGGYDSNALNFTCGGAHPSSSPDNSDWIAGDHYGNDLFAVEGTPAIAVVSGTITHSGYSGISGNRVTIMDSCGWHYFSAHLENIAPGMNVGSYVSAGTVIGTVGDTGNAAGTQAHIHFSIYPESYSAGIDPFPLLQGVDESSCTGEASLGEGESPSPAINPCTDADIGSDDAESSFAFVVGSGAGSEVGGLGGNFQAALPANGANYTVGRWGPWISHTGLWEVDVFVPDTNLQLTQNALYEVVFQGGRTVVSVDQQANKGSWVTLSPQPLKFLEGPRAYVGLTNATPPGDSGAIAFDGVRYRYIGVATGASLGSSCQVSMDCSGTATCSSGVCTADCATTGCAIGTCDIGSGVCTVPAGDEGFVPGEPIADSDGDGIPNYLEGDDDPDGDGLPSFLDPDSDGDGILDSIEGAMDSDGDGIIDSQDLDSDNDGLLDEDEVGEYDDLPLDSDLDGIPDFQDNDSDNDGIPDDVESGGEWPGADTDGDGIPNHLDLDSDNDGTPDLDEAGYVGDDPMDSDGDGIPDYIDNDREAGPGLGDIDADADPFANGAGCAQSPSTPSPLWLLLMAPFVVRRRRS